MNHLLCDLSSDSFVTFVNQDMLEDQANNNNNNLSGSESQSESTTSTGSEKHEASFSPDSPNLSKNSDSSPTPLWSSQLAEPSLSTQDLVNPEVLGHDLLSGGNWSQFYHMGGMPGYAAPSTPINFLSSDCQSLEYFNFTSTLSAAIPHPLMLDVPNYGTQLHTSPFYDGSILQTSPGTESTRSFSPKIQNKRKTREKKTASTSTSNRSYYPPPPVANIAPKPPSAPEIYVPNFAYKIPTATTSEAKYTSSVPPSSQQPPVRTEPDPARTQALNKRQERLIKNRAAALLSRKRKREQMLSLEAMNEELLKLNQQYKNRISQLENQLLYLGAIPLPEIQPGHTVDMNESSMTISPVQKIEPEQRKLKPINTVFMILFFSLVFFSLPPTSNIPFNQLPIKNEPHGQVLSTVSMSSPSRKQSFQVRTPSKELLALPEADSRSVDISDNESPPSKVRAISPQSSSNKQEVCMRELFDWLTRGLAETRPSLNSTGSSNHTDLIPASVSIDTPYVFAPNLQSYISPQRFRSPNAQTRSSKSSGRTTSKTHSTSTFPKFSLLSPWVEEPGSKAHNRLMKLDVQVLSLSVIDSNPLSRYN